MSSTMPFVHAVPRFRPTTLAVTAPLPALYHENTRATVTSRVGPGSIAIVRPLSESGPTRPAGPGHASAQLELQVRSAGPKMAARCSAHWQGQS
eukprot:3330363-Rhodomonas_salina.1